MTRPTSRARPLTDGHVGVDEHAGVVILGMHRSGTSAVAGMFVRAGYFAGDDQELMPAAEDNPAGYYENLRIFEANERVLERLGGSWFDPPTDDVQLAARDAVLPELKAEFDALVENAAGRPVVIKDPRITVMLPLWSELIAGRLSAVVAIRDPLEVAQSLSRRNGIEIVVGAAIWELYMATLLEHLDGQEVLIAPYAALVGDCELRSRLVALATAKLDPSCAAHVDPRAAAAAVLPGLRNEVTAADHEQYLTAHQLRLFEFVSSIPEGTVRLKAQASMRAPSEHARATTRAQAMHTATELARDALAEELATERSRLAEISADAARATSQAEERSSHIRHLDQHIEELHGHIRHRDGLVEELGSDLRERAEEAGREAAVAERLAAEVKGLVAEVSRLLARERQLEAERERAVAELERCTFALHDAERRYLGIVGSRRWRAASRLAGPLDSWRRLARH